MLEAVGSTVIGIRDLDVPWKQGNPVLQRSRTAAAEFAQMAGVHGDEQVEAFEIIGAKRARPLVAELIAPFSGVVLGALIGGFARMPALNAGRVDPDPVGDAERLQLVAEDTLGGGGPADVAGADEQDGELGGGHGARLWRSSPLLPAGDHRDRLDGRPYHVSVSADRAPSASAKAVIDWLCPRA